MLRYTEPEQQMMRLTTKLLSIIDVRDVYADSAAQTPQRARVGTHQGHVLPATVTNVVDSIAHAEKSKGLWSAVMIYLMMGTTPTIDVKEGFAGFAGRMQAATGIGAQLAHAQGVTTFSC